MKFIRTLALVACVVVGHPASSPAQTTFPLAISGNTASVTVELGGLAVDLTLTFEQVVGLNAGALQVSARVISPFDSSLLSRLPGSLGGVLTGGLPQASIPAAFPVLIQIEPTEASALTLSGIVNISLHTHNLTLEPDSTLGLFTAPLGGPFRDITRSVGIGSYRVDGSGGGFSEFLIAADNRAIDTIISEKFNALQSALTEHEHAIDPTVLANLRQRLGMALTLYLNGSTLGAIGEVTAFERLVKARSGESIPDVWSAHGQATNVAGLLRSMANTLKFSLTIKATRSM